MRIYFYVVIMFLFASCHVTETIKIAKDGTGTIETEELRDEDSYLKITGENYSKEETYQDTTYLFKDIIKKYEANFSKLITSEKDLLSKYNDVEVSIKKNSYAKEFVTRIYQKFEKIENVPDFYKIENYKDDLKYNYSIAAEEHYFSLSYSFDGTVFRRIVKITNKQTQAQKTEEISEMLSHLVKLKINQTYVLNYTFPRKIKYVSNLDAKISEDKKSINLKFLLSDCAKNPDITNLEIVLEDIINE